MDSHLIDLLFEKGKKRGFDAQEIYFLENKNVEISVFDGEIDKYNLSEDGGLSYRGITSGKMGYAYTEILDDHALDMLVDEAYNNAIIIENEDEVFLHDGSGSYTEINNFNPELSKVPMQDKIQLMLELETDLKAYDPRIKRIAQNGYNEVESTRWIKNTYGLDMKDTVNYCLAYAMTVVEEDGDTRTGIGYDVSNDFSKLSKKNIVVNASNEALSMLGAKSIKSKTCPVVIKNEIFAQLFSAYIGIFSAERVQKNLSGLKDKLGHKIASECFTVIVDPHMALALSSSSFDAEGVATQKKSIIEDGKLITYLHNLKTANKDNVKSTGNASKGSYKGTIGISPSNLTILPGALSFDDMVATIDEGVYIVDLQGLHAGIDSISGDFSLQCYGYEIIKGKIDRPISQITVAGNFFEMLNNIELLANDLKYTILSSDYTGAPSVKISALTISGE